MISPDGHPPCRKKCQTSLDSVHSCTYCVYSFDIAIRVQGLFTCGTQILATASIQGWQVFRSARPGVRRQFESGV